MSHVTQRLLRATPRATPLCAAIGLALCVFGAQAAAADTTRVIVTFNNAQAAPAARQAMARLGAAIKVNLAHVNAVAVELPASAVARLQRLPGVKAVEADPKRYLLGEPRSATRAPMSADLAEQMMSGEGPLRQRVPYGIRLVQSNGTPKSNAEPVKVCIIDSGLDSRHPDLAGVAMDGAQDAVAGGWNQLPLGSHGTHVAGTIAAADNTEGVLGVASRGEVSLYIVRVFGADDKWSYSSDLAAAARQCQSAGAKVINMSLGGYFGSNAERETFAQLERDGILSVAAAGNDGARIKNYPASYPSVISVAAVDADAVWAPFSTFNAEVEISAPGAGIWSTMPLGAGGASAVRQAGKGYSSVPLEGSPETGMSKPVVAATYDFGLGDAVDAGAAGKTCLIARGTISFADKVLNCQASGGVSAVIYNNVPGNFNGTLGTTVTSIPSVSVSDVDGAAMKAAAPAETRLRVAAIDYSVMSGTSMASPHVAGVAAKLWRANPGCTNTQIRESMNRSAIDLGTPGRDEKTGYGLVQLRAAHERIQEMGCGN